MTTFELILAIAYPLILLAGGYMIAMLQKILKILQDLFEIHNVKDPRRPGAYVWYSHDAEILEELRAIRDEMRALIQAMQRQLDAS